MKKERPGCHSVGWKDGKGVCGGEIGKGLGV